MRKTLWEKRIPTLLGILLIAISIEVTSFLVNKGVLLTSKASPSETPLSVRISNISDTSLTVSYSTQESVPGIVSYGKDTNFGQTAYDDKQQLGETKPYKTHYITIRNLSPLTKYYFSIISGKSTFLNDTVPFEVSTAPTLALSPTDEQPISGKVILPNGETPKEGVVYVTIPGAQTISTMVKADGSYIIPLNSIRNENLSSYTQISKDSVLHMLFVEGELESRVTVSKKLANPVGIVTLSHTYDFTSVSDALENASASTKTTSGFPSFSAKETPGIDPKIITPKKDEGFLDQQPLFKGTAAANETVTITIHSENVITAQIKAGSNGVWSYRPSSALSPGQHTISIVSKGSSEVLKTVTQSFTVYAQGSQVTQTATPSATPTVVITPTISATPTPTPTIIVIPSPTPLPPPISKGGQELPSPGSSIVPVGVMALGTTFVGVVLFSPDPRGILAMRVGIIGAGFTGLSAGYNLGKRGHQVTIFEKDNQPGGLAVGYREKEWEWTLEKHYHHWFTNDASVLNLAKEINHPVYTKRPQTNWFVRGKIYKFVSLKAALTFPLLTPLERVRQLGVLGLLRLNPFWKPLERYKTNDIMPKLMGEKTYTLLWKSILKNKFGEYADDISLAWFWARIKKRTQSLSYPTGGFLTFAQHLVQEIEKNTGKVVFNTEILQLFENTDKTITITIKKDDPPAGGKSDLAGGIKKEVFDKVIVTLPSYLFLKIAPQLPTDYKEKLVKLKGLGATNLILRLKKPFFPDNTYWLSIADTNSPIMAIVEHTNFMDKKYYNNEHLVYLGNYLNVNDKQFLMDKEKLLQLFDPFLRKINPLYHKHLIGYELFKAPFAQPIIPTNYSQCIPPFVTPLQNVYLANIEQVYPWDRGTNYAVELGEKIADYILNEN